MKKFLFLLVCISFIFSCEEKLKEGEYYDTITLKWHSEMDKTVKVKVTQIDTVYEENGRRYIGGWVDKYPYWVGPFGDGTTINYRGTGYKGYSNNHSWQGTVMQFNKEGDTISKAEHVDGKKNGKGIEIHVTRGSSYGDSWDQYIGDFKFGKKHGRGTWKSSKGRVRDGLWEYGHFLGEETFDVELSKSKVVPESVQELCVLEINLEKKIIR